MSKNRGKTGGSTRNTKKKVNVSSAVDDKTFGMKNKKGKKAQVQIKQVRNSVISSTGRREEGPKLSKKELKEKEKEQIMVLGFVPHQKKKKEVKKAAQVDMFVDLRSQRKNSTFVDDLERKTCSHYKESSEEDKMGWFWACPNGPNCAYRHAFPEGYVLEKKVYEDLDEDTRSLVEILEEKRKNINRDGLKKITLESFLEWKKEKKKIETAARKEKEDQRKKELKKGAKETGREIFMKNANIADDDDDDDEGFDLLALKREKEEEENLYDMEAALQANSNLIIALEKGPMILLMTGGIECPFDPELFILDESVPSL